MPGVVADTHALVWHVCNRSMLSVAARRALEDATQTGFPIHLSAISLIEITYLVEKGKLPAEVLRRLLGSVDDPAAGLSIASIDRGVVEAVGRVPRDLVPDLPDRVIAATALRLGLPLVTRDAKIRASGIPVIW